MSAALMAMALQAMGQEAIGLTGSQAGIYSRAAHGAGRIERIDADRIEDELRSGRIPIVAGFQGVTEELDYVTLGRGASDLTAVALGVALQADRCETYKDVEGVYTADPRVVPNARRLIDLHYEEMLEMATQGSQVMHNRAVELAATHELPILVASSMIDVPGTLIHGGPEMEERNRVRSVVDDHDIAKVTLRHVPDQRGIAARIFEPLAEAAISVDTIVQNASEQKLTDLTFTIAHEDLRRAEGLMESICESIGANGYTTETNLGKVSIVGAGIQTESGYAARMFRALADANVNIDLITTSEIRITCIVHSDHVGKAVNALHKAFGLDQEA
tara:strand:+ start:5512 stop:6507 length:996 start_codon:yes stop_codon:yes gene_type:complete